MKSFLLFLFLCSTITISAKVSSNSNSPGEEYAAFADNMPEPVGGLEGIYKLIEYPQTAIEAGVQGKVYLLTFVNEKGDVDDVKIVKGLGAGCDEAAINAVKQTKFKPGNSAGKDIKVKLSLQIQFKLT